MNEPKFLINNAWNTSLDIARAIQEKKNMSNEEELPDNKPFWDNHYEDEYSDDPENGYPYDNGTKVQE